MVLGVIHTSLEKQEDPEEPARLPGMAEVGLGQMTEFLGRQAQLLVSDLNTLLFSCKQVSWTKLNRELTIHIKRT